MLREVCYRTWTSDPATARKAADAAISLSAIADDPQIRAIGLWISGIADITRGRLEKALDELKAAAGAFLALGQEADAGQPFVAELMVLAMLGRYKEALKTGGRALEIFEEHGDELAAAKIELNISNILSRLERHREAETYALRARKRSLKLGETGLQTMAENGLANTYTELNDLRNASRYFEMALKSASDAGMTVTQAEIEASIGNLEFQKGRYDKALRYLELSRRKYELLGIPQQAAIAELEIADLYLELNLTREAFEIYEQVAGRLSKARLRAEEARARANLGRAAHKLRKNVVARNQLTRAERLYEREGNAVGAAFAELSLAEIDRSQGRPAAASARVKRAIRQLERCESPRHKLAALWLNAELLRDEGKLKRAEACYTRLAEEAKRLGQQRYEHSALNALGKVAYSKGDARSARRRFKAAASRIDSSRSLLPSEDLKIAFLDERTEPFLNLGRLALDRGRPAEAFIWFERARSRALIDSMFGSKSEGSATGRMGMKRAALREELNWLYARGAAAAPADRFGRRAAKLEREIGRIDRQIAAAAKRKAARVRDGGSGRSGRDETDAIRMRLGACRALVEFAEIDGGYSAFVVTTGGVRYFDGLGVREEIEERIQALRFQVGAMKYGAGNLAGMESLLKKRADAVLAELYDTLLKPIETEVEGRDLIVVASGPLHYVPFHALRNGGGYLVESRTVTQAPSAGVWLRLRTSASPTEQNALLFGYSDEAIPLAEKEVKRIARYFKDPIKRIGRNATFSEFTVLASKAGCIHIACHASFRADNPMFSALHLADGWVTVGDVCRQKLRAGLVTLSACETGMNEIAGGEELLGLARGFLTAGAQNIVLSLWPASDSAAAELMQEFYSAMQRGQGPAASLRIAQKKFIDRGDHPYFWAPFYVIGA